MSPGLFFVGSVFLATLLIGSPLLLLLHALRRYRREASRGGQTMPFFVAAIAALPVLAYNTLLSLMTTAATLSGGTTLSWAHVVGLTGAWCCFWVWVGMNVLRTRRSRRIA